MNNIRTIKDINNYLSSGSFPVILPEEAGKITSAISRDSFIAALLNIHTDEVARNYVKEALVNAGVYERMSRTTDIEGRQLPASANNQSRSVDAKAGNREHVTTMAGYNARDGFRNNFDNRQESNIGEQHQANNVESEHAQGNINHNCFGNRKSYHVYGGKAALCFEADKNKRDMETIAIDAAVVISDRKYNWNDKTRIQITKSELPVIASVFLGMQKSCEFKNHGEKGFSMENQGNKVFIKVMEKGKPIRAVPVEFSDMFYVTGLILEQLSKLTGLTPLELTNILAYQNKNVNDKSQQLRQRPAPQFSNNGNSGVQNGHMHHNQ